MELKHLSQIWNYFKKGRSELGLLLSLYTMALTYSIRYDFDFTGTQYAIIIGVFCIACALLGVFLAEKVDPENQRISPYAQDGVKCALDFQIAMIYDFQGDTEKAIYHMRKAVDRRSKWLKARDEFEFLVLGEDLP